MKIVLPDGDSDFLVVLKRETEKIERELISDFPELIGEVTSIGFLGVS